MVAYGQFTISALNDGTSVESVSVQYYLSTSRTKLTGGSWGATCPSVSDGHYVWTRTGTKLSDSATVNYSQPACITGDKGATGASGKGIVSVTPLYLMNESKESCAEPPTGWTDDPSTLTWEAGKYIWTTSKIVYSNPSSTVYTTPSCDTAWEAANEVQNNLDTYKQTNDAAVAAQAQTLAKHTSSISTISSTVDDHTNQIANKVSQSDFNSSIQGIENDIDKSTGINKWLVEIYSKDSLPKANRTLYDFAAFTGSGINPTSSATYKDSDISKSFLSTTNYIGYALTFVDVTTQFTWTHGFSASGNGRLYVNGSQVTGTTITLKVGWNVIEVIWNVGTTKPNGFTFSNKLGTNSNVLLMNCYHRTITGREASEVTRTSELTIDLNGITSRVSSAETNINTNAGNITTLNQSVSTVSQTADKINWLVKSGSSQSSVTLTDAAVTAVTNQFVIKDPEGSATIISGGKIQANSITANMLAANAIKSQNYRTYDKDGHQVTDGIPYNSPYSTFGTLLDLSTGSIYTPNFGVDNANGNAYINGEIIATSGRIGGESGTYWDITQVEEDSQDHAAIIANGRAFINTGDWTIAADRIHSQSVNAQKNLVYPSYNKRYYDFGLHVPELNPAASGYIEHVSDDFLYIRYHDNNVPSIESDWNYIFRVDKNGMIYINGLSLDQKYASIDGVSGAYLPRTGGTITGDLTVNGTLSANASSATKLNNSISVNGKSFNGESSVNVGTIGVGYGGTGRTAWTAAGIVYASTANTLGQLDTGTSGQILSSGGNTAPTWINQSSIAAGSATKDSAGHTISSYYAPLSGATFTGDVTFTEGATFSGATFTGDVVFTDGVTVGQTFDAIEATVGDLMVTGAARFTNGLYGDLIGNADTATTADKVGSNLVILLNSGTTEGTNKFTYNGSATKNVNITKSAIGLGNVDNTADANKTVKEAGKVTNTLKIQLNGGTTEGTNQFSYDGSATKNINITKSSVGLGNVDNTADANKTVKEAGKVTNTLKIQLNGGTTEGTNQFSYDGSAVKNINITKSSVGLGNVENTALSTWAGSANLTTTKVGTLAAAAIKGVDTSISASSTSANLPTSAAVAAFVEGKGYVTSSGVTSITLKAGTGVSLDTDNTAITSTGTRTISLANTYGDTKNPYGTKTKNYVLAGPASGNAAVPTFRALVADDIPTLTPAKAGLGNVTNDKQVKGLSSGTTSGHLVSWGANGYTVADSGIAVSSVNKTVKSLASNNDGKIVLTYLDGTTSDPIEVKIIGSSGSSVSYADALNVNGTAVGGAEQPVFINNQGKPQTANKIPKLNNGTTGGTFYAPTAAGTSGQFLKSSGSGAPTWETISKSTVGLGNVANLDQSKAIKSITKSGGTYTATALDGTTSTFSESVTGVKGSEESTYRIGNVSLTAHNVGALAYNDTIFSTNSFASGIYRKLYMSKIDNAFFALDKRYTVTATNDGVAVTNVAQFFDGNYEGNITHIEDGKTAVITINFGTKFNGYPYGYIYVSFYNYCIPSSITARVYNTYESQGVGWHNLTFEKYDNSIFKSEHQGYYGMQILEITIVGSSDTPYGYTSPTEIEFQPTRPDPYAHNPMVTKFGPQTLYYDITAPNFIGNLNGTATKATQDGDGAVISSTYAKLSGATFTGAINTANGTWNTIGDDAYLGDINKSGHIGIKGKNGNTGLFFVTYNQNSNTTGGAITWDGTKFSISGTVDTSISGNATTATKFSSNRSITLTGDVVGTANSNGENGWSLTTAVVDDSHNHTTETIVPLQAKTYTGVIAEANNEAKGQLYFIKVQPDTYGGQWSIHYKVTATIDGVSVANGSGFETSNVYLSGMRDTYSTYRTWNDITNTSYRPYYYHCFFRAKEAGITNGYGHAIGVNLRYSYNPATAANTRTVTFEIIESKGCTVTLLDSPLTYDSFPGTGSTNYNTYNNFDATTQGNTMTGDRNDSNYYNRNYYGSRTAAANIYRYQLCLTKKDRSLLPINSVNNSISTDKTLTTEAFDPFGDILYWSSTTTYSAGANVGDGWYAQYLADIRYSFNIGGYNTTSTLVGRKPLYLVATPQADGTAVLHSSPLAQDLPTTEDGLIYIYLGQVYQDTHPYRLYLTILHPIYWYKNGAVRQYIQTSEKALQDGNGAIISSTYAKLSGATFTGAVSGTSFSGTSFAASNYMTVNSGNSGTAGGLALYGTTPTTYGIAMRNTSNGGKHGYVQGDWGIYNYMSGATNRGFVWKAAGTNVASIDGLGDAAFNGSVTIGTTGTDINGSCSLVMDRNLNCLNFVFN